VRSSRQPALNSVLVGPIANSVTRLPAGAALGRGAVPPITNSAAASTIREKFPLGTPNELSSINGSLTHPRFRVQTRLRVQNVRSARAHYETAVGGQRHSAMTSPPAIRAQLDSAACHQLGQRPYTRPEADPNPVKLQPTLNSTASVSTPRLPTSLSKLCATLTHRVARPVQVPSRCCIQLYRMIVLVPLPGGRE